MGGSKEKARIQLTEKRDTNNLYPGKIVHIKGMYACSTFVCVHVCEFLLIAPKMFDECT